MKDDKVALTGAQKSEIDARYQAGIALVIEKMQIRKWCVEQAVKIASDGSLTETPQIKEIINFFYDFITKKESSDEKNSDPSA